MTSSHFAVKSFKKKYFPNYRKIRQYTHCILFYNSGEQ